MDNSGCKESTWSIDIKIVMYAVACWLAYWSHFLVKFPKDWHLIVICLAIYGVICIIHYYLEHFVEKQAFYWAKQNQVNFTSTERVLF